MFRPGFLGPNWAITQKRQAWRSRLVLADRLKRIKILLLCWLGAPIEFLIRTLQYLDEIGKGLWDAVVDSPLNPFTTCRRQLTTLLLDGVTGAVSPLFLDLGVPAHNSLVRELRTVGLDLGAQVR